MTTSPLLDSRLPIVAAPMAGGPSSLALGAGVVSAGAFPFLAAGYKTPEALATEIAAARSWNAPFGVNLFSPGAIEPDPTAFAAYVAQLPPAASPWTAPFGFTLFSPGAIEPDQTAFAAYVGQLRPEATFYDLELDPTPRSDDDYWHEKLALLLEDPVAVVSFTFA